MVALSPGASLPRRGSTVVTISRLGVARWRGAPDLLFVGKLSTMRVRRVELAPVEVLELWERSRSMESWMVALSTARGECLSGRELHLCSNRVRHRGTIKLSAPCGKVIFWQSDSQ